MRRLRPTRLPSTLLGYDSFHGSRSVAAAWETPRGRLDCDADLPATQLVTVDLAAQQRAQRRTDERTGCALVTARRRIAEERFTGRADNQACRAVVASAIIAAVPRAPHVHSACDVLGLSVAPVTVIRDALMILNIINYRIININLFNT